MVACRRNQVIKIIMKKILPFLFSIIPFLMGCSDLALPTEIQLNSSVDGKNVIVFSNQAFTLELDAHFDGGYQWDYEISDTNVVGIDSVSYRAKEAGEMKCGGLVIETFYLRGKHRGQSAINLIEHQSWEKDVPPINTVHFYVIVK